MKEKRYHSSRRRGTAVGADVGATLAKLAVRDQRGSLTYRLAAVDALEEIAVAIRAARPETIGVTGGGAESLARRLGTEFSRVNEFAAWGAGLEAMLDSEQMAPGDRYLGVSVGTGTSVLLVDGLSVSRVGGTALGGGTVMGLGAALLGTTSFSEIVELAARGSRSRVDLLVSDIYRAGEIPLPGDLTAANFGKLGLLRGSDRPSREDLAHAIMGLVGENVALVCGGLAAAAQVSRVIFAGSTLRENSALVEVLTQITRALGREPVILPKGEFAGAVGALRLASAS